MPDTHTFFIDESGDSGTRQIRSREQGGATPYMTLGGVLVRDCDLDDLTSHLSSVAEELKVLSLHCADMNHNKKIQYTKRMVGQPIVCFGVISYKPTLEGYKEDIGEEYWRYYHKCAQYLLERLGHYLTLHNIPKENIAIVFEASNHLRLQPFQNFISICQQNPKKPETALLSQIMTSKIATADKGDNPLLQLADLVAHAQYQCVNKTDSNFGNTEIRYLNEMRSLFFASPETNKILKWGILPAHHIHEWDLNDDVRQFFSELATH